MVLDDYIKNSQAKLLLVSKKWEIFLIVHSFSLGCFGGSGKDVSIQIY